MSRHSVRELLQVILIKTNPCVFVLCFKNGPPLLLQSYRRTELVIFLLTQREGMHPKTVVARSQGLKLFFNGIEKTLFFDKLIDSSGTNSYQDKMLDSLQLNNFVNAIKCSYLGKLESSFMRGVRWETKFVVLTNVGLLYFTNPLQPPNDLFPVLDCIVSKCEPNECMGDMFSFQLTYQRKHITFKCPNLAEYSSWMYQIR